MQDLNIKKSWGKFKTKSHKFEFFSETLKEALGKHAKKHHVSIDEVLDVCNYEARGDLAFVPHYETPFRYGSFEEYPFTFIDHRSRLNKEGRSANLTWYQEFKKKSTLVMIAGMTFLRSTLTMLLNLG